MSDGEFCDLDILKLCLQALSLCYEVKSCKRKQILIDERSDCIEAKASHQFNELPGKILGHGNFFVY